MTVAGSRSADDVATDPRWLSVIGIGDDGWDGLGATARCLIERADLIVGGTRHIAHIAKVPCVDAERRIWTGDFATSVGNLAQERGRSVVVLASGDPLLYGVGILIARTFDQNEIRIIPHVSAFAYVCAHMVWPQSDVQQISLCGRPVERLRGVLGDGQKLVVLSADGTTPAIVAGYLRAHGFGDSTIHILEHLAGAAKAYHAVIAADVAVDARFADLNALAIECRAGIDAVALPSVAGLPDDVFDHDGQITKREVRAVTLARLAPEPGELLWDIGLGSGAIAIEWLRSAPGTRAIGIERKPARAARARRNADALGVPGLTVVEGTATDVIDDMERPHAIFIGGGLTSNGLVAACWQALLPGGRLVANTVTLESEAVLLEAFSSHGGDLSRIAIERADPVGRMTGWRPAMTVTQWAVTKPRESTLR